MDLILCFSKRSTLLAFRQTSRGFRRRVDELLATHISIHVRRQANVKMQVVIEGPYGAIPGIPSEWAARPPASLDNPAEILKTRRSAGRVLVNTRVVDVRGPISVEMLKDGPSVAHVETIRFRENSIGYRPVDAHDGHVRVVAFATLDPDTDRGQHLCPIPRSARRLTATLRCLPRTPARMPTFALPESLAHITLVFRVRNPQRHRIRRKSDYHAPPTEGLIATLAGLVANVLPGMTITLVDIDKLDLVNLGYPRIAALGPAEPAFAQRKLLQTAGALMKYEFPDASGEEIVATLRDGLEFCSLAEYEARLGVLECMVELDEDADWTSLVPVQKR